MAEAGKAFGEAVDAAALTDPRIPVYADCTGAPYGPCEIYDVVGLDTGYNIVKKYVHVPKFIAGYDFKAIAKLLEGYKNAGKTGVNAGEGFFKYDEMGHRISGD